MLRRLVNLPFAVAGKAARAFQAREDARVAAQFGRVEDPGQLVNNTHALPFLHTPPEVVQITAGQLAGRGVQHLHRTLRRRTYRGVSVVGARPRFT